MNRKAKRVSKFFVVLFVFLLALALVLGSTGAYYRAMRSATGTIHLQKGIVVDYTGFSGEDVEWTSANATSFELFDERSAIPGEDINLVQTSIKADATSVNFYARARIEYAFDGTNNGSPVSNIQNISNIPFTASDLITADVFASNWKQSANDEWNYFVSGDTYGTFVAGGAYTNIFKQGAKLSIEGTNFHGADDEGSGGGFIIAGTDYVITTIRASLVIEFIQANAGAVSDMNWNYVEQEEDPAPAIYPDPSGVTYTLNNEGTGYIVTGGIISQDGNGGSVSGYSAKVGNSSASAYDNTYDYTILSYIHGLPVIEVAANAFAGNYDNLHIVIPTTVVLIGENAINIYGSVTFETGRLNAITIRVNGIPTGTTLPNGSTFDGLEAVDVPELYTLTLIDNKDNYYSFWEDYCSENGYTYQGNGTYTIRLPYGTVGQLPAPTFDGYTFQHWYDEEDEVNLPANEDLTIEGDVTAVAVYAENGQEPETYTVTIYVNSEYENYFNKISGWNYDGKAGYITKTFSEGSDVTFPTPNEYNNQTLLGHYDTNPNKTSNPQAFGSTKSNISSNWTYYFIYEGISGGSTEYTVSIYTASRDGDFNLEGWNSTGDSWYSKTVSAGEDITLPSYTYFGHWSYSQGGAQNYSSNETFSVYENKTLYFVDRTYDFRLYDDKGDYDEGTYFWNDWLSSHSSFSRNNDEEYTALYVTDGFSVELPSPTTSQNYTFLYWERNGNQYYAGTTYTIEYPESSFDFYAVWESAPSTTYVYSESELRSALNDYNVSSITLSSDIYITDVIRAQLRTDVTLDGNGYTVYASQSGTLKDYAFVFTAGDSNGSILIDDLNLVINDGFRSGIMAKYDNGYSVNVTLEDVDIEISHTSHPQRDKTYKNCVGIQNNSSTVTLKGDCRIKIDEYCWAAIDLDSSEDGASLTFYDGANVTFVANNKGSMYEALVKVNEYYSVYVNGYSAQGLVSTSYGYDYPTTTYVYSESELRSALNDSSVYSIALGENIYISDVIRATISREVTLDGNGYTIYASQSGTLKDYAFVFTAGDSNGSIVIDDLNLVINDGFRSGMMLKKENSGNFTATLQDSSITIDHSSQPYKSGNPKNCVAIENNDSALIIKGSTTLTIDEYCWAAIDLDNSNNHVSLTFYDGANVTFVAENKGSMFEALVKVNEASGYNLVVSGYAAQGLVATLYGYDDDTTTYVYSESDLSSALNDPTVYSITLGADITISSTIRAAISDRDVVLNGAGYTITASQGGTLKDYAFIFESGSYNGAILIKDLTIIVNDGFRSAIKAEKKDDGRVSVILRNTNITIAHSYHPTKDKVTKNCVAIQNNYSRIYLRGTSTITIDAYCWAAIDLDSGNGDAYLCFSEGANITFVAENKGSMYEALVKVNGKNSSVYGAAAQGLVSTLNGYDYEQQSSGHTITLRFADTKYMDNFDSSEFNDWTPLYGKYSEITGYYMDGISDGDKIYLPDDGKTTGYVWAYTDNDKDYSLEPGSTYKVYGDMTFTYQSGSSSTSCTISLKFNDASLINSNFKSGVFDGWTPIYDKYDNITGYSMSVESGSKITLPNDNVDGYIWYYSNGMVSVNPGDSYTVNNDGVQFVYQEGTVSTNYQDVIIDLNGYYDYSTSDAWYMQFVMMSGFQPYGMNQFKKRFTSTGSFTLPLITRDGYTLLGYTANMSTYYPGMNTLYQAGSAQMVMMLSGGTTTYYAQWQQGVGGTLTLQCSMMTYIDNTWTSEFAALGWTNNGSSVSKTSDGDPITLPQVSVNYMGQTKIISYYSTASYEMPGMPSMGTHYNPGQSYTPAGNSTLYIVWTNGATLTLYNEFDEESGHEWNYGKTSFTPGEQHYVSYVGGGSVELPSPTLDGYTFAYWQGSNGDLYAPGATYSLNGNNTLTAVWLSGTTYTVTLDVTNSGVDDESRFNWTGYYSNITKNSYQYQIVVEENDSITLPTSAYYLGSWVDANDGSHSENMGATYQVTSDITFNFNYTGDVTRYTLTLDFAQDYGNNQDRYDWRSPYYYFNPGSLSFDGNYIYHEDEENAVITLPTAKVYNNRLIQGYFNTDSDGQGTTYQLGDTFTLTDDITLYFISTGYEQYCTITLYTNGYLYLISNYDGWELDGNSLVKSVTSGTTITLPTSNDPRVSWEDYDAGAEYYVEYGTSLYLQIKEIYTATLNLNGNSAHITDGLAEWENQGEGIYTKQVKEGVRFSVPTLESGYYWSFEDDGDTEYVTDEDPYIYSSTTFTLVYVETYTATLHLNGLTPDTGSFWNKFTNNGDGTYSRSFNVVDDWDLPRDWYFNSDSSNRMYWWFTDQECTNPVYNTYNWVEGFTSDVDFYATSGPEQMTIYYNANGGTIDDGDFTYSNGVYVRINVYYNNELGSSNLPTPTKEGYTFLGWYANAAFTGVNYSEFIKGSYSNNRGGDGINIAVLGNGTTLYAKYSENYVQSNVVYTWNEDDSSWSVVGVTDEFNAETLTIESSIDDGAGHSGNVVKIADSAFVGTKVKSSGNRGGDEEERVYYSFTQVVVPATVVEIGDRAFYYNRDLETVTFAPNSTLQTIGEQAFNYSYLSSFYIPASVTTIGREAFDDCVFLTGITVDENNQTFSSYYGVVYNKDQTEIKIMTQGLTGIDGTVKIPATVTTINKYMYGNFVNLVFEGDITFGSTHSGYRGNDYWDSYLYYDGRLTTITFTNTDPTTLGRVYDCSGSYTVFVPAAYVEEYNSFFSNHDMNWSAVSVSEKDDISPTNTLLEGVEYDDTYECYIYVDSDGIVYHLNQDGETYTLFDATDASLSKYDMYNELQIGRTGPYNMFDVTAIAEDAFRGISATFSIQLGISVQTIGAYAFYDCTGLYLGDSDLSASSIGAYAFYNVGSQLDSSVEIYLSSIGNLTIGAHAFDGAKWYRLKIKTFKSNTTVSIGEYAFANNSYSSGAKVELGDDEVVITFNIAANAFDGTEIERFYLGDDNYSNGSRGLTFNFATDSLSGADIEEIRSYFPNTIISGLENSGISSSTDIYMPTDAAVDTMAVLLPNNDVENYYRKDYGDCIDSSGVVYRYMPVPGKAFYDYGYMLYSVPSDIEGTYTVPATISGYTVYGIWPGAFDDTQLTAVNFSVKANTDGGRAIVRTFANLPTTNANIQTITYGMFASLYEIISADSNFSSYTIEEIEEPHKLAISTDDSGYFNNMSDYSYGYINNYGYGYYKPFISTTPSFSLPSSNRENYELTFRVYVWNENDDYWQNTKDILQGGATFNPADYSTDVRLDPNWEWVEEQQGTIVLYSKVSYSDNGWEYSGEKEEYTLTKYVSVGNGTYFPSEKYMNSLSGYTFCGWYASSNWDGDHPIDSNDSVNYAEIDYDGQYLEYYGYWQSK